MNLMEVCVVNEHSSHRSNDESGNIIISIYINHPGRPGCGQGPGAVSLATCLSSVGSTRDCNQAELEPSNRSHAKAPGRL